VGFVLFGQAAYADDLLKEYGDLIVGRWVGKVKLIADWPGTGKQGEIVVGHLAVRWISDKKGLEDEWFGGNGTGKSIYVWDAKSKKIKQVGVDSGGTVAEWYIWKEKGKWVFEGGGCLADGEKFQGKGTVDVEDDGNTFTYVGSFTMDGKKLLDLRDVYKRASH
jgi:hypothetical protein